MAVPLESPPPPLSLTTAGREGRQPFFQKELRPLTIGLCPRTPHSPWEKSLGSPCPPPDVCPVLVWPQKDPLTVYRQAASGASLRGLLLHQLAVSRTPGKLGWRGQGGQPMLPPGESGQDLPSLSLPGHASKTTLPWKPGACPHLSYCSGHKAIHAHSFFEIAPTYKKYAFCKCFYKCNF